jgi:hypothetical protein
MDQKTNPENGLTAILARVVAAEDNDRLRSLTGLLNAFNFAVQVQSNRNNWETKDFRLFAIALCAMDQIGKEAGTTDETFLAPNQF